MGESEETKEISLLFTKGELTTIAIQANEHCKSVHKYLADIISQQTGVSVSSYNKSNEQKRYKK